MKNTIGWVVAASLILLMSCHTPKQTNNSNSSGEPLTHGVISQQYHSTGCSSVILVDSESEGNVLTLIPKNPIPSKIDKEGTKVTFRYRLLRMPNPEGCPTGIPAEISELKASK